MADILTATQNAFYAALNVVGVTALGTLVQHVPEDSLPPLIIVGDISLEPIGGKDGGLDRAKVEIVTISRAPKRAVLFAMQAAVRVALDGMPLTATGAIFSPAIMTASDGQLIEDGLTYVGTQQFETFVQ